MWKLKTELKSKTVPLAILLIAIMALSCTTKETKTPFSFVQICDTQLGFGAKGYDHDVNTFNQAVEQINTLNPDFVVICGDLINIPGGTNAYKDFKKIVSRLNMPCYPASGNHDVTNEPNDSTLTFYRKVMGNDYYKVSHKGYGILIVNTQLWKYYVEGESETHDQWVRNSLHDLKETNTPSFVVGHYPLFISDPEEEEQYFNIPTEKRKELLSIFDESNVQAYLSGHTHKLVINTYKDIQLVSGETTSKNFDARPFGFRVWDVSKDTIKHHFIALEKYQLD